MTARELLANDRLSEALDQQSQSRHDAASRLFYVELLILGERFADARAELKAIESDDPAWPASRRSLLRLVRGAAHRHTGRRPDILTKPPRHLLYRWNALRCARAGDDRQAVRWADRAEHRRVVVSGHINGRIFNDLRDTDQRFESVLELIADGVYLWLPFEAMKRLTVLPVQFVVDSIYRPVQIELTDGRPFDAHLPCVYPGTLVPGRDESFALGRDTDYTDRGGLVCGIGARTWVFGEEELTIDDIRQIDIQSFQTVTDEPS